MHVDYSCTDDQNEQLIKRLMDTGLVIVRGTFVDDRPAAEHRPASSTADDHDHGNLELRAMTEGTNKN